MNPKQIKVKYLVWLKKKVRNEVKNGLNTMITGYAELKDSDSVNRVIYLKKHL